MHRIDAAGYAAGNLFTDGNPSTGTPATVVDAAWLNDIQENLAQLVEVAGVPLIKGDYSQLLKAIVTKGMQGSYFNIGTAGGTADAITSSYSPPITVLSNGMTLYVRAGSANATSTPTFTPNSGTIAAKTIVKGAGSALAAGDIAGGGHWIELQYDALLDKWVLLNPAMGISGAVLAALQGGARNLVGSSTGTSAVVTYTVDEVLTGDSAGSYQSTRNWNSTITMTNAGPGGLDTGSVAASTKYFAYAITKPDGTKAFIASLSATGPSFSNAPGYTKWARIGSFCTDGTANKYPLPFSQFGNRITFSPGPGKNLTSFPLLTSGVVGTYGTTMAAVSTASFTPPTARKVSVIVQQAATTNGGISVSSNSVYGASTGNAPGYANMVAYMGVLPVEIPFETQGTLYVAAQGSTATFITGYEENF